MSRYDRPKFAYDDYKKLVSPTQSKGPGGKPPDEREAANRLLFDWWCDDDDRAAFIASLKGVPTPVPSRSLRQDDPAPLLTAPAPQGFRNVLLISNPTQVHRALTRPDEFSNVPYAALGGASFLLAQDPTKPKPGSDEVNWHGAQHDFIVDALQYNNVDGLRALADRAIEDAALVSLAQANFDLAEFAERATLRYMGLLFGYAFSDHGLLEDASRAVYRALQYIAIGQHFVSEPGTLPAAQQALARLVTRTSQLMEDYTRLKRSPRLYRDGCSNGWPDGVQPWCELGIEATLDEPVLRRATALPGVLSGRDRATVLATLLSGTLGNVQSAVCLLVRAALDDRTGNEWEERRTTKNRETLENRVIARLAAFPPITVVPRRTLKKVDEDGLDIEPGVDCLLLLEGGTSCPHQTEHAHCPHIWGAAFGERPATHACLGRHVSTPLIAALVQYTLRLPGLKADRDRLTAEPLKLERLWGFGCTRYPLVFERDRVRTQKNLIVAMRVKSPIADNAARLRRLIAGAAPTIEDVLRGFGHVHFAWFEFTDDDSQLVLRTIYDGQFEAYIQYFALRAGDLFDGLFEFLEGAPPRPVAEHPQEFVETIRRYNRAPLAGYLYSAYPDVTANVVAGQRRPP